jgi:hypothetical protein
MAVCEVDLETKEIRFLGCEDDEAMINAAEKRLALVTSQLSARSGLTNRERRELNREGDILCRWLFPDDKRLATQRGEHARLINRHNRALSGEKWRKPSKRERREARRHYREQHTVQKRPDYRPAAVLPETTRQELIKSREKQVKKQAWFERKHGKEVNGTGCHDVATEARPVCAETAHVTG